MSDYYFKDKKICIVFGKTGVGKSSFINGITNTSEPLKVSDEAEACTVDFEPRVCKSQKNIVFIDTPGLLDVKGDENNECRIQHALSDFKISYILILLKFGDVRVDKSIIDMLQSYMKFLPMKDFWDHVIIVYTNAKTKDEDFEEDKQKVEGKIIKTLDKEDFKEFKNFMIDEGIDLPKKLKEYYCDNRNNPKKDQSNNKEEYQKILCLIENSKPMIKNIENEDFEEINDGDDGFKYWSKKRKTIYTTSLGQKIKKEFTLQKEELSKYEVLETKEWKKKMCVDKKCFKKQKTLYHYFRQKKYKIENDTKWGNVCKYKESWQEE